MTDKREEVVRAICGVSDLDCTAPDCPCWNLRQHEAQAAIEAHEKALEAEGLVIVPRHPTVGMIDAMREVSGKRALWKAGVDAALEASHG